MRNILRRGGTGVALLVTSSILIGCQQTNSPNEPWDLRSNPAGEAQPTATYKPAQSNAASSQGQPPAQPNRTTFKIRLRRDAMGIASSSLVLSPFNDGGPTFPATITGVIEERTDAWVTVNADDHIYIIPTGSILMIEQVR